MKITFNSINAVTGVITNDEPLRQGNVGANTLTAVFEGKSNLAYTATFNYTRSNDGRLKDIPMTPTANAGEYYYKFSNPWFFAVYGETTLTVYLKNSANEIVASGQITFSIEQTDFDDDPNITYSEYQALLDSLAIRQIEYEPHNVRGYDTLVSAESDLLQLAFGQIIIVKTDPVKIYQVQENEEFELYLAPLDSVGAYLPLAGGTMSGAISQPIAPVEDDDLANKKYVDDEVKVANDDIADIIYGDLTVHTAYHAEMDIYGNVIPTTYATKVENALKQSLSEKGQADGYASLDGTGKVPSTQLPAYVDDILEFANLASFPATGTSGIIYVALDTNLTYRWSGSGYTEISPSLALGETSATAYRGDRGKTAYDHSQLTTGNPHNVQADEIPFDKTVKNLLAATNIQGAIDELADEVLTSLDNKYSKNAVFTLDVANSYIRNSGEIGSESTNKRTDYIYIKGYKSLSFSTRAANISNLAFFTKDKVFIDALKQVSVASGTIDLTDAQYDNAYFVIVSAYNPNGQEYLQLIGDEISKFDIDYKMVQQLYPTNVKAKSVPYEFDGLIKYGDGTIDTSYSGFRTDMIDISFVKKIYWKTNTNMPSNEYCYVSFYDKDKKYLQSLSVRGGTPNYGVIDLTQLEYAKAKYVMCSCFTSNTGNAYRSQCGLLLEEFNEYELDNFSKNAYEEINKTTKWKVKTIRFTTQGNINKDTGALENTSSTDRKCIDDYISIKGYSKMIVSSFYNPNIIMLYDKNKRLVKTYTLTDLDANNKYIFEFDLDNDEQFEDVEYVRANLYYGDAVYNEKNFYVRLIAKNTEKPLNKFSGKNVLIFGDSITDTCNFTVNSSNQTTKYTFRRYTQGTYNNRTMWSYIFNEMYALKEMRNYARSSATWQITDRTEDRINAVSQVTIALNDKNNPNGVFNQSVFNPDIIVFALGVNDGAPNDTYEEAMSKTVYVSETSVIDVDATLANLDKTKFNQAMRWSLLRVKKEWLSAQIFVSLAISGGTGNSNYRTSINDAIIKMAQRCGCIVIDSAQNSGIIPEGNSNGAGQTLADGLHPNDLGCKMLARCIISKIDSCYMDIGEMGEN